MSLKKHFNLLIERPATSYNYPEYQRGDKDFKLNVKEYVSIGNSVEEELFFHGHDKALKLFKRLVIRTQSFWGCYLYSDFRTRVASDFPSRMVWGLVVEHGARRQGLAKGPPTELYRMLDNGHISSLETLYIKEEQKGSEFPEWWRIGVRVAPIFIQENGDLMEKIRKLEDCVSVLASSI